MTTNIIDRLNRNILAKANAMDKTETERIINVYQQMWDNGESFTADDMMSALYGTQRSGENDEAELAAAVHTTEIDLTNKVIIKAWLKTMTRDDAIVICNNLAVDGFADIDIFGITLTTNELITGWNKEHPDAQPIHLTIRAMDELFGI